MKGMIKRLVDRMAEQVAAAVSESLDYERLAAAVAFGPGKNPLGILGTYGYVALDEIRAINQATQRLLTLRYQELLRQGVPLPKLIDTEFRSFSQNGEDGILHFLFSVLGFTNRRAVEICAGDGLECNAANLILNHGFEALLLEGDQDKVDFGNIYYTNCRDTLVSPPTFLQRWITRANVNDLIREQGFEGPLDLFSLDLDGVDYWIWQALDCIDPRVVLVEYNPIWGPDNPMTVPYRDDFALDFSQTPFYCGASLAAFVQLAREKGYRLIGCNRLQFNAFFLRNDVGADLFPEVPAASCLVNVAQDEHDWGERMWERV